MVRNIPSFVFCYKFYLIIKKIKAKSLVGENNTCASITRLYAYLDLNVIAISKFVLK